MYILYSSNICLAGARTVSREEECGRIVVVALEQDTHKSTHNVINDDAAPSAVRCGVLMPSSSFGFSSGKHMM